MASKAAAISEARTIVRSEKLDLVIPECPKGIGEPISMADSPHLIAGVRIQPLTLWPDDRGYFLEVQRFGYGLAAGFPAEKAQISAALNYPGTIKAFHYHLHQTDCWTPVAGFCSSRWWICGPVRRLTASATRSTTGALRPWQILIPPGVAHGYKIVGQEPARLVYVTDRFYDPADEGRIAYDDPHINYDWATQHK